MIYGYIRVSTGKQTYENQRFEIEKFARANDIKIDKWISETISGATDFRLRKLSRMIKKIQHDDLIITTELSRLGRNLLQLMGILHMLADSGARLWTVRDEFRLGDDVASKVLAFAFGLSAEIERKMISERTREALAARRAAGVHIGRPRGRRNSHTKLSGREGRIQSLLATGHSNSAAAKKLRVHRATLARFIRENPCIFAQKTI